MLGAIDVRIVVQDTVNAVVVQQDTKDALKSISRRKQRPYPVG
jgi:hypothetical protein